MSNLSPMFDSAGQPFNAGMYIAFSGDNNKADEYGMVIGKIVEVSNTKDVIKYERFDVKYNNGIPTITKRVASKKFGKFVVVDPATHIKKLFDMPFNEYNYPSISHKIANWLHQGYYSG